MTIDPRLGCQLDLEEFEFRKAGISWADSKLIIRLTMEPLGIWGDPKSRRWTTRCRQDDWQTLWTLAQEIAEDLADEHSTIIQYFVSAGMVAQYVSHNHGVIRYAKPAGIW